MDKIQNLRIPANKLLVKVFRDKALEEKEKSLDAIVMTEEQKTNAMTEAVKGKIGSTLVMKAEIVKLGSNLDPEMMYKVGDFVYVFPKTFESDWILDGQRYLLYAERNVQAKVDRTPEDDVNSSIVNSNLAQTNIGDTAPTSIKLN